MHAVALLSGTGAWLCGGRGRRARVGTALPGQPAPGAARGQPRGQHPLRRWPQGTDAIPETDFQSHRGPHSPPAQPRVGDTKRSARHEDALLHPQTTPPAPKPPPAEAPAAGHPPARRGGSRSLGRACAGATTGTLELKITLLSSNRLVLAPATPAAWGLDAGSRPPPAARGHGEKGAGMEPAGAARPGAGSRQDPPM